MASIQVVAGSIDGDAGPHPGLHRAAVVLGAQGGQLDAVVGALHLPAVRGDDGGDPAARRSRASASTSVRYFSPWALSVVTLPSASRSTAASKA